jgi:hypothetical protein
MAPYQETKFSHMPQQSVLPRGRATRFILAPFVGSNQKSEGQNVRMSTLMFVRWDLILVKKYTRLLSRKHERR